MKRKGEYCSYLLYEVSNEELEITNSAGSRYIRNSILIFKPSEEKPKLGEEWRIGKDIKEAQEIIDEAEIKKSMKEQLQAASERSETQKQMVQQAERNRVEYDENNIVREK